MGHACIVQMLAIMQGCVSSELFFHKRIIGFPNLNGSIGAQHKHDSTMRAMRVNSQITEVMQL